MASSVRRAFGTVLSLGFAIALVAPACSSGSDPDSGDSGTGADSGTGSGGRGKGTGAAGNGSGGDLSLAGSSSGATSGTGASSGLGGAGAVCAPSGGACKSGGDCCSGQCDAVRGVCATNLAACGSVGAICESGIECCSLSCHDGRCSETQCSGDGEACESGQECCSGRCADSVCADINGAFSCATAGNACENDGDCCSKLCGENGFCLLGSSFCVQLGDLCTDNEQCCHGTCAIEDGATIGYCQVQVGSGSRCDNKLMAGEVCEGDCAACCSRACAPHPTSGKTICQPPSGCRPEGELCRTDRDCCGGDPDADLPGAGNATCEDINEQGIGRCKNRGCTPQGGICKYDDADYVEFCGGNSTSPNNCCNFLGANSNCALDLLQIPRCDAISECREAGEACATASDCCGGVPCVQDESGAFVCYDPPGECVPASGPCTVDADCCRGSLCLRRPGAATGTCGDGSVDPPDDGSGGGPDQGTGGGGGLECAAYGQTCSQSSDCCEDVPCSGGRCLYIIK